MTASPPPITDKWSPSGRYYIKTERVVHGENQWSTLRHEVYSSEHDLIAITERNYSKTFLYFVEDHAGSDWLIVSENYHGGHGAIDLHTGQKYIHDPRNVPWYLGGRYGRKVGRFLRNKGYTLTRSIKWATDLRWKLIDRLGASEYWCWADLVGFDKEKQTIEVSGCYWVYPYEIVTFDFSNPSKLPYKELTRRDEPEEDEEDVSDGE